MSIREDFEREVGSNYPLARRQDDGSYLSHHTEGAWHAWRRAALCYQTEMKAQAVLQCEAAVLAPGRHDFTALAVQAQLRNAILTLPIRGAK